MWIRGGGTVRRDRGPCRRDDPPGNGTRHGAIGMRYRTSRDDGGGRRRYHLKSSPHRIQPLGRIDGKPVAWGLRNSLPPRVSRTGATTASAMAVVHQDGMIGACLIPVEFVRTGHPSPVGHIPAGACLATPDSREGPNHRCGSSRRRGHRSFPAADAGPVRSGAELPSDRRPRPRQRTVRRRRTERPPPSRFRRQPRTCARPYPGW